MAKKSVKKAIIASALAMTVCTGMLIGTTYAWFTDTALSTGNVIKSGTLEVGFNYADAAEDPADTQLWQDAENTTIFKDSVLWEPGYTQAYHLQVVNEGSLALKYNLVIEPVGYPDPESDIAEVIDVYYSVPAKQINNRGEVSEKLQKIGTLSQVMKNTSLVAQATSGHLSSGGAEAKVTLALKMQETAGNEYQDKQVNAGFNVKLFATQWTEEKDSFDDQYDRLATYSKDLILSIDGVNVTVPADSFDQDDTFELSVTNKTVETDAEGVTTASFDISLKKNGVTIDTPEPGTVYGVEINIGKGLIVSGVTHNGDPVENFTYNALTGIVSFQTATFSNFKVIYQKAKEITFDGNGATSGSMETQSFYANVPVTLNANAFERDGYDFVGWATTADGEKAYDDGAEFLGADSATLYAVWEAKEYKLTINASGATVTASVGGTNVSNGGNVACGKVVKIQLSYTYTGMLDTQEFSVTSGGNAVTRYSDEACTRSTTSTDPSTYYFKMPVGDVTVNAVSSNSFTCVAKGTHITLADGTSKHVEDITADDLLLVWDMETGTYKASKTLYVEKQSSQVCAVIHTYFSDGTDVQVVGEHGFFDLDLGKYVFISTNTTEDYIGHKFVKRGSIDNNTWQVVTLNDVSIEIKETEVYSPATVKQICCFTEDILSTAAMIGCPDALVNIFEVNTDSLTYDQEKMQADIETYGLFEYDDLKDLVSEEVFDAFNAAWIKVSIGKGLTTMDTIAALVEQFSYLFG